MLARHGMSAVLVSMELTSTFPTWCPFLSDGWAQGNPWHWCCRPRVRHTQCSLERYYTLTAKVRLHMRHALQTFPSPWFVGWSMHTSPNDSVWWHGKYPSACFQIWTDWLMSSFLLRLKCLATRWQWPASWLECLLKLSRRERAGREVASGICIESARAFQIDRHDIIPIVLWMPSAAWSIWAACEKDHTAAIIEDALIHAQKRGGGGHVANMRRELLCANMSFEQQLHCVSSTTTFTDALYQTHCRSGREACSDVNELGSLESTVAAESFSQRWICSAHFAAGS